MNTAEGRAQKEMMFTLRERAILAFVAKGFHNEEIAEDLEISLEEVLIYQAELLEKMNFRNIPLAIKSILKEKLGNTNTLVQDKIFAAETPRRRFF